MGGGVPIGRSARTILRHPRKANASRWKARVASGGCRRNSVIGAWHTGRRCSKQSTGWLPRRSRMPELRARLDPCNPGQFYACCGLFEIAAAQCTGAAARFVCDEDRPRAAEFVVDGPSLPAWEPLLTSVRDLE